MWLLDRSQILNLVPSLICNLDVFPKASLQIRVVAQHYDFVLCDVQIGFNSMRAGIDCGTKGAQSVFWIFGFVTAVIDTLWTFSLRSGKMRLYEGWRRA
jgi:hypothetical protein